MSLYDVTSCLASRSHVPSGGSLSLVLCSFRGVSVQGGSLSGGGGALFRGVSVRDPHMVKSSGTQPTGMRSCLICCNIFQNLMIELTCNIQGVSNPNLIEVG